MKRSSFIRKGATAPLDPTGTRPGLHGQVLVSSGHPDLDRILGGGLPLGSLLLLLEDGSSRHHVTLLRYFLGEGAACGQAVALAAAEEPAGGLAQFIPQQLKRSAASRGEDPVAAEQEQYTLRIAWQYRRYLKPPAHQGHASASAARPPATAAAAGPGSGCGLVAGGGSPRADAPASMAVAEDGGSGGRRVRIAAPAASDGLARLKDWCHEFDLTRGLGQAALGQCRAEFLSCLGPQPSALLVAGAAAFVHSLYAFDTPATTTASEPAPEQQQATTPAATEGRGGGWEGGVGPRQALAGQALSPLRGPRQVGRLAVLSFGSPGWWGEQECTPCASPCGFPLEAAAAASGAGAAVGAEAGVARGAGEEEARQEVAPGRQLLRALLALKAAVRERRCAAVASVPAALLSADSVARLAHLADAVLALESVADDSGIARLAPDSASVAGLLHVRKLPALGAAAPPAPEAALYLIRNKRRWLSITPVEIDPDAEAGMGDGEAPSRPGVGGAAASLMRSGRPLRDSSALDF